MKSLFPPPIRPGGRIGIAAPGGPVLREPFERGVAYLERRGFRPVLGKHVGGRHAFLAGTDRERLEDLNALAADPDIQAIWCARGGYGSARIVEGLDYEALRRHPKSIIGYSDITVLQSAVFRRLRLASWQGPLVVELGNPAAFDEASLWSAVTGDGRDLSWSLPQASVARAGKGSGPLVGGCLSIVVALIGTPYEVPMDGAVLFWEEVNEEPFRIDRMLGRLRQSGRLKNLSGMVVGRLVNCQSKDPQSDMPLLEILETHLAGTDYPVVVDFPAGHCPGKTTLPFGRSVTLDTSNLSLAVSGR
jgi:muramoyltetrapeptide carboxypeptidase